MKNSLLTFIICFITSSFFAQNDLSLIQEQYLIPIANKNGITVYNAENNFMNNLPGIVFHEDGSLTKKQNMGWCGTPPINYEEIKGKWKYNDATNLIELTYNNFRGQVFEEWMIVNLKENQAQFKMINKKRI